jgi:hypothetical protein
MIAVFHTISNSTPEYPADSEISDACVKTVFVQYAKRAGDVSRGTLLNA